MGEIAEGGGSVRSAPARGGGSTGHEPDILAMAGSQVPGQRPTAEPAPAGDGGDDTGQLAGISADAQERLAELKETVVETVGSQATAATEVAKTRGRAAGTFVREHALLVVGLAVLAVTVVVGVLVARGRLRRHSLISDVVHHALKAGENALDKGEDLAKGIAKSVHA
jgi:ElaB/YqjD/DUF883 family membrane-anchored ribosome-binding protein